MKGIIRAIRSLLAGEVSTAGLRARRGAGSAAYSLLEDAAAATGADKGTRLFRLCAWNAFALQAIADTLLDADAAADPMTAGYVPRSTLDFVGACLDAVPGWIRQAQIVRSDPSARIAAALPAQLPHWRYDEPTRHVELRGLRTAYEALQPRVESDLESHAAAAPPERAREVAHLRRVCAEMTSSAEYANALDLGHAGAVDRGAARSRLLHALQRAFELGQLLALPSLVEIVQVRDDREAELPLSPHASWLQIGPAWPVLDGAGANVGLVQRVRGNRETGEFEGLDVDTGLANTLLRVPAEEIAEIGAGQIRLAR
ncbi:MAG: hypothetical protein ACYDCH_06625 [Gaiellaceae bacterium]